MSKEIKDKKRSNVITNTIRYNTKYIFEMYNNRKEYSKENNLMYGVFTLYLCNHNHDLDKKRLNKIIINDIYNILQRKLNEDILLQIELKINKNIHLYANHTQNQVFSIINALLLMHIKEEIIKKYKLCEDFELQKNLYINENESIIEIFRKTKNKYYNINYKNYFEIAKIESNFILHFLHVCNLFKKNLTNETQILKNVKEKETRKMALMRINKLLSKNNEGKLENNSNFLVIDLGNKNVTMEEYTTDLIFLALYKQIKETNTRKIHIYVSINEFVDVFDFFKEFVSSIRKFYGKIDYNVRQFSLFKYALNEKLNKIKNCKVVNDIKIYCNTKRKKFLLSLSALHIKVFKKTLPILH